MPCPWVTHTKCSWRPLVLPPDIQREMLFCISKPRPAPSQHAVRAVSKCSGKQPRLIFQPLENKQPISEVIINSFGRGLSNTSCMQRDRFQTRTQKKKKEKKASFPVGLIFQECSVPCHLLLVQGATDIACSPMAQCCCTQDNLSLHCCLVLRDNLCIIL